MTYTTERTEPPRGTLLAYLRDLLAKADIGDIRQWASDTLGRLVTNLSRLSVPDIESLIDELVLETNTTRDCRATGPNGEKCLFHWPGHPLWCCDKDGNEWLARDV